MIPRLALIALLLAAPAARAAEVEVGYGRDHLDRGYRAWQVASVEVAGAPSERLELRGGARGTERFGLRDLELSAALVHRALPRWAFSLDGAFSPTHRVLPAGAAAAHAARELGRGWVGSGGLRWVEYRAETGRTDGLVGDAGLEWYAGAYRLAGTGYLATLAGAWSGAGRIAADRFYGAGGRAGLALAAGQDLESTGQRVLRTAVRYAGLSGRHPLAEGWSITWELSVQRQGDSYTRTGGRLGIRRRF